MKILLDANLPHDLRLELADHEVFTAAYLGWSSKENGELLAAAAAEGFEALITLDRGMMYSHSVATLPLSVIVLRVKRGNLSTFVRCSPSCGRCSAQSKVDRFT